MRYIKKERVYQKRSWTCQNHFAQLQVRRLIHASGGRECWCTNHIMLWTEWFQIK